MSIKFNPSVGIEISDAEAIRKQVQDFWQSAFRKEGLPDLNVEPETPQGQIIDSQTAAIMEKDSQILYLAAQLNPRTAEGIWQDALAQLYFLQRHVESPSIVTCSCKGLTGVIIPQGAIIQADTGLRLKAMSSGIIADTGEVSINFQAETPGDIPIGAGTANVIITLVPGWDSVTNETAGVTGRNGETRAEFDRRIRASVSVNSHGSAKTLYAALASIQGVAALSLLENTAPGTVSLWGVDVPGHSFFISIYGGDDYLIAKAIYEKKDAGAGTAGNTDIAYIDPSFGNALYKYKIHRPEPLALGIKVVLRQTADTPENIATIIKDEVYKNFEGQTEAASERVSMASIVYASRFYQSVMNVLGGKLISIQVAAPMVDNSGEWADEITINADVVPVLNYNHIIVEVLE